MDQIPTFFFGFNKNTEVLNGRLAMIGFILIFLTETLLGQPLLKVFNFIG